MSHAMGYEKRDINTKKLFIAIFLLLAVVVICAVAVDQYFVLAKERIYERQVLKAENTELKELHQKEIETLTNYKLLDPAKGTVRIPIDRAMELLVLEKSK